MNEWQPMETAPFNTDVELWSPSDGKCVGRHKSVGYEAGSFIRRWVSIDGGYLDPHYWRPVMPPCDVDECRQFHNRVRIIMNLEDDAFPPALRADNPSSAALWAKGRENRVMAFIAAPDAVAKAIWNAVVEYEGGSA